MDFLHILRVAWFTFAQAALSTLMALIIGLPAAFFCGRRKFFGRRFLLSLSVVPFCVPSLIIALGYVTFLGLNGGLNHFLMFVFGFKEPPLRILYSFTGLIIVHGFYNFPLIMKNVSDAWKRLPSEPADCARLLGAGEGRIFRTVTIYQLLPSIASSSLLVFIYCFLSFILVLLFGGIGNSTLEVEIYKAARASLNFGQAAGLAIVEVVILAIVTVFYCLLEQGGKRTKGLAAQNHLIEKKISGWKEILPFTILILLIITFFIAPLAGIVVNAFSYTQSRSGSGAAEISLKTFERIFKMKSFVPSILSTLKIACCTGFVCMVIGFLYSVLLRFLEGRTGPKMSVFLNVLPMLPMSISSVVIGLLIMMIVRRGNIACLVLAQSLLNWPLAFRIINPQLSKINRDTMDSALLLSKNPFDVIFRVILPVCVPSLLSAFGFCFALSAGDTTLPLVMAIKKLDTLSLFTYRLAGAYRFKEACASGLILGAICAFVYWLSSLSVNKRK